MAGEVGLRLVTLTLRKDGFEVRLSNKSYRNKSDDLICKPNIDVDSSLSLYATRDRDKVTATVH